MFTWIVTRRTLGILAVTIALAGGCGSREEAPPPASESVTTDPLQVEMPAPEQSGETTAPAAGQPAGEENAAP